MHPVSDLFVRPLVPADWAAVEAIYREGIATGEATFESAPPSWSEFDAGKVPSLRFVAVDESGVVGWAAASPTSAREVYRGVVEHSVYVSDAARNRGIGRMLVTALIAAADEAGVWTIQSSVFRENTASLSLHRGLGFREVGTRERIGLMAHGPHAGQWRDTVLIERRSAGS